MSIPYMRQNDTALTGVDGAAAGAGVSGRGRGLLPIKTHLENCGHSLLHKYRIPASVFFRPKTLRERPEKSFGRADSPGAFCNIGHFALQNGLYCTAKWPILETKTTLCCNPLAVSRLRGRAETASQTPRMAARNAPWHPAKLHEYAPRTACLYASKG